MNSDASMREFEQEIALGSHYGLIRERNLLRAQVAELVEAMSNLTCIGRTSEGHVLVGPRGWEIMREVLAKVKP